MCELIEDMHALATVVVVVHNFKLVFAKTPRPIKAKLYVDHPLEGATKVYINGPGHMTKMATSAINSTNLKKSPEPISTSIRNSSPS